MRLPDKRRRTSNPSMPGIWTSRNIRSGECSRTAAIASRPLRAWPQISMSSYSASRISRPRRASSSSSTISALSISFLEGNIDCDSQARWFVWRQSECLCVAVQLLQALPRVLEPHTARLLAVIAVAESRTSIRQLQNQGALLHPSRDTQRPAIFNRRNGVLDRVLNQRLQNQTRYERFGGVIIDVLLNDQPVPEADFFDF